ncbi:MAG TPA: NAD(P)/FAD-dependent oxidoreductase [Cyclobacteriaceae bacterium]|nr:NAD(P)/FAD-dependent oxidoreductase [Cyclobacteriaceae bacterium]
MKSAVIIGGGLAGLVAAIQMARCAIPCLVIEKNQYPAHKVCGEYVSNEALPFLNSVSMLPGHFDRFPKIEKFLLSASGGKSVHLRLDMGGFGISRYCFDNHLYQIARAAGVEFRLNTTAQDTVFSDDQFTVSFGNETVRADVVIGAFGKRSRMDVSLKRPFMDRPSPWVAVKYHVETDFPEDTIALHNFQGGYCGVVRVEDGITNLCYLVKRSRLKASGSVTAMETTIAGENPWLDTLFAKCKRRFERPLVINEISFETKAPVEQHILMAGDAAGMIAPLCGNGMAMAIHSGKLAAEVAGSYCRGALTRAEMEATYAALWKSEFAGRLRVGRHLQKLFAGDTASRLAVTMGNIKPVARWLMRQSHGRTF